MKRLPAFLAFAGLLLTLPAACLLRAPKLRSSDFEAAFGRVASGSLGGLGARQAVDLAAISSDTGRWRRVTDAWGDPGYIVAVLAPGGKSIDCLSDLHLDVEVTIDRRPAELKDATEPVYGYSSRCRSEGFRFLAPPGAAIKIHVVAEQDQAEAGAELVILHYWSWDVKDRIVGVDLHEDLMRVEGFSGVAGVVLLALGLILSMRGRGSPGAPSVR